MKKRMISMSVVALFVATLAAVSVHAQSAGNATISIPFEFVAGGKTFAAGDYYVTRNFDGSRAVLRIQSKIDHASIFLATHPVQSADIQDATKLVFNKYGQQHFLSQVWTAGRSTGEELNKSSRERGLQQQLAQSKARPETVAIRSN